jgi:hypothetical protein
MRRRREIALLLSPFLASALICEAFSARRGYPCGSHGGRPLSKPTRREAQANIARLEKAGSVPSTSTLQRVAKATGHKLTITFTRTA